LTVSGGAAVAKNMWIGGVARISSTIDASSSSVGGSLTVSGGASVGM
jgi:hypothetical protein